MKILNRAISRRQFAALVGGIVSTPVFSRAAENAGRKLDFQIGDGFGGAGAADITAVIRSAADSIWRHCPDTRWEVPGFFVYRDKRYPITLDDHRDDGRIAIGLDTQDTYWAQYAFQFAHEFCHALAGHSNDWHKPAIRGRRPNHWLEESFCETASLFALRAMGKSWLTEPPYPNWKSYAGSLTDYAAERLAAAAKDLPDEKNFAAWVRENEASMRENPTIRPKNSVVAMKLLPLFEAMPSGWEAITFFNLGKIDPEISLAGKLADWKSVAPESQKKFIAEIGAVFDVKI